MCAVPSPASFTHTEVAYLSRNDVSEPNTVERLHAEADEVVVVETPPHFSAVGQFYGSFEQVSDDEAMLYLEG